MIPGPPQLMPGRPDAVIDLRSAEGAALVGAQWRYCDAAYLPAAFVGVGADLGPSGSPNQTVDIAPHAQAADFDDRAWRVLQPEELELRLGNGLVSACWYRTSLTIPERIGELDPTGATIVFEVVVDDYAEVWVNGRQERAIGDSGTNVVSGFNAPNRVVLTRDARPNERFDLAVFGMNGPVSATPRNYIWVRTATLDVYVNASVGESVSFHLERLDAGLDEVVRAADTTVERIAAGFEFTEGPVWVDGALLFSAPNTNTIFRWAPEGRVSVFRPKSGYSGIDIGRYRQPGSNGLALDPEGRLTICQHGNRRVVRVNPHGDLTVMADSYQGMRLNSPNDLTYAADGTLYFTDPPFGLPEQADDLKRELAFAGVFNVRDGVISLLTAALAGPNGIALSPDERTLYVGDWDPEHKAVMAYDLDDAGEIVAERTLVDLTGEPGDDAIDGIKVDRMGNLFVCGPGGIWVIAPAGTPLGLLRLPEAPHNLAFGDGDGDGNTLYICALDSVYRMRRRS